MTTKLREGFIAFCRSKWRFAYYIAYCAMFVLFLIYTFSEKRNATLWVISYIIVYLLSIGSCVIKAIKRCEEEKCLKNHLIYIILSDNDVIEVIMIAPVIILAVLVCALLTIDANIFNMICVGIICILITNIFSDPISNYFKKKLSE